MEVRIYGSRHGGLKEWIWRVTMLAVAGLARVARHVHHPVHRHREADPESCVTAQRPNKNTKPKTLNPALNDSQGL